MQKVEFPSNPCLPYLSLLCFIQYTDFSTELNLSNRSAELTGILNETLPLIGPHNIVIGPTVYHGLQTTSSVY